MHERRVAPHEMERRARDALARLQLWHAFDRVTAGDRDWPFAFFHWTALWRFLPAEREDPEEAKTRPPEERNACRTAVEELGRMLRDAAPGRDHEAFCDNALAWLTPRFDRFDRGRDENPPPEPAWFGCFRAQAEDEGAASLHIYNACAPESPFDDMPALFDDLRTCLAYLLTQHPDTKRIGCGSWINNLAPFQALFPAEYIDSLTPTDPDGKSGLGWWGQFLTRTGTLNEKRAAELRATGRFHYARLHGSCAVEPLQAHLARGDG